MKKNIYVCGPTVYNSPHIGNLRPIVVFDIYARALEALGYEVDLVHNITDVDDKIINKALEEKTTEQVISERYFSEYQELLLNMNINSINHMPKVTNNMEEIISFIEKIIKNKNAYVSNGSVYFSVNSIPNYGQISNRKMDKTITSTNSDKKHPQDFALWKKTNEGVQFDSPWSKGRPGWHTECVAIIDNLFKHETIDIHGGGTDLLFPHHENENAQFFALNKKEITHKWKHIGQLSYDGEKMSKSLGNVILASEFIDKYEADTLRMIFLTSSVTAPISIDKKVIEQAQVLINKYEVAFNKAQLENIKEISIEKIANLISNWKFAEVNKLIANTIKQFNKDSSNASLVYSYLKTIGFNFTKNNLSNEDKQMYAEWNLLINQKDYEKADILRKKLIKLKLI